MATRAPEVLGRVCESLIRKFFIRRLKRRSSSPNSTSDADAGKINILVFHGELFRGDLEELIRCSGVAIFVLDVRVQFFLKRLVYRRSDNTIDYYQNEQSGNSARRTKLCRGFIVGVLRKLFSELQISGVMTANVRYLEDLDWCISAESLGVPWIVLYREGLLMFPRAIEGSRRRHQLFGFFYGSHIVAQNEVVKEMFVESEFASAHQVSVCGAPRAERLKRRMNQFAQKCESHPQVLILFFSPGKHQSTIRDNLGIRPPGIPKTLFERFMHEIIDMSLAYPEIMFCIKPKRDDEGIQAFYDFLSDRNIGIDDLPNIQINDRIDFYDALSESNVICGLQTTAVLEAAVIGKPVILPFFKEYRESDWSSRFGYKDHLELFDVPEDEGQLRDMILEKIDTADCSQDVLQRRRALFSKWISPMNINSSEATISVVRQVCQERSRRNERPE